MAETEHPKDKTAKELISDVLDEKLSEMEETKKSKDNYEKLSDKIDQQLKGRAKEKVDEHEHDPNAQQKDHVHATHSSDQSCPTCGDKNPEYSADQATCQDCGAPVGTVKEIESGEVTTCRNCGGKNAEHGSKGWGL